MKRDIKVRMRFITIVLNSLNIDFDSFYTMSISNYTISLQGNYNSVLIAKLIKKGCVIEINSYGYAQCKIGKIIEITLT
jgi:hypothetical protein